MMRRIAWIYVVGVLGSGAAVSLAMLAEYSPRQPSPWLFLGLTVVTTFMRLSVVEAPGHRAYEGSTIGLVAGLLLLPPWLFVSLTALTHGVEWAWVRQRHPTSPHLRAWYIQPFNMAKCIIGGGGAYVVGAFVHSSAWGPLPLAGILTNLLTIGTYVIINQMLLGLALALARGLSFRRAGIWRDALLIETPLACVGYVAVEMMQHHPLLTPLTLAPVILIYQAFMVPKLQDEAVQALERFNQDLTAANQAIRELNDELFLTLAKVFDARDPYVGGHAAQVAAYAVAIAAEMGLSSECVETIRQSAYLHDIGKIAIPEAILHKPGRLTRTEYAFVRRHADIGADLISTSHGLRHLAPAIRHHHERWDGRGYPAGLAGEAIPLEARILNVCDSVEAMASDRPYQRAMSLGEIVAELQWCAGSQFDPKVVDGFVRLAEREGAVFVVNSARTVAAQYAGSLIAAEGLAATLFAQAYAVQIEENDG